VNTLRRRRQAWVIVLDRAHEGAHYVVGSRESPGFTIELDAARALPFYERRFAVAFMRAHLELAAGGWRIVPVWI
jgi:hypothetical protein